MLQNSKAKPRSMQYENEASCRHLDSLNSQQREAVSELIHHSSSQGMDWSRKLHQLQKEQA